jgi:CubicO group peptidase (beta-lactamase class C family)
MGRTLRRLANLILVVALLPSVAVANDVRFSDGDALRRVMSNQNLPIHAILVASDKDILFEEYRSGLDQPWGQAKGIYTYNAETLHDVRSISKSIVSLLVGIAWAAGKIDLDSPVFRYLPEYADLADPGKSKITVRNLLAMDSGLVANESVAYADPNNTERLMSQSEDPYRYALGRKQISPSGERWAYDSASTMLLARILQKVTGADLLQLAQGQLFQPLGIESYEWKWLRKSHAYAAHGGLRLRPRDLAKIGRLILGKGRWNGRQLVSEKWLALSTSPVHDGWYPERYGLHWWIGEEKDGHPALIEALGIGGQRLYILPERGLVVVIAAGIYDNPDQLAMMRKLLYEEILPRVR